MLPVQGIPSFNMMALGMALLHTACTVPGCELILEMQQKLQYLKYELNPHRLEHFPVDWDSLFEGSAPLAVEIGFGNGDFLIAWAQQEPNWNFVGIELSLASMEKILKRIYQTRTTNIKPLREDARFAMREFFADNSVRQVMMNFPDPWPKERHKHRRLLNEAFILTLSAVLEENGMYELVTDQEWYARDAFQLFAASPCFDVQPVETDPQRAVATKYEQKWREMGRHTYRLTARKIKSSTIHRLLEDTAMPHVFVERELQEPDIENLVGYQEQQQQQLFVVKEAFRAIEEAKFLLRVIARDEDYQQTFWVAVKREPSGRWLVKLDPALQPYRTPAVKMAVWQIGEKLKGTGKYTR